MNNTDIFLHTLKLQHEYKEAPAVEMERKRGKWEITDAFPHIVYCGVCHKRYAQTQWQVWKDGTLPRNFCPNCGAQFDERSEDE